MVCVVVCFYCEADYFTIHILKFNSFSNTARTHNTGLAKWLSDTQANAQKPLRQARKRYVPLAEPQAGRP
jgi:hypothetical protein